MQFLTCNDWKWIILIFLYDVFLMRSQPFYDCMVAHQPPNPQNTKSYLSSLSWALWPNNKTKFSQKIFYFDHKIIEKR